MSVEESTISSKYQVVIPKKVRKQLGIKPGQKVEIRSDVSGNVTITPKLSPSDIIKKYAGTMPGAWGDEDPTEMIRRERDASDRGGFSDRRD